MPAIRETVARRRAGRRPPRACCTLPLMPERFVIRAVSVPRHREELITLFMSPRPF